MSVCNVISGEKVTSAQHLLFLLLGHLLHLGEFVKIGRVISICLLITLAVVIIRNIISNVLICQVCVKTELLVSTIVFVIHLFKILSF